ncbi:MAG: hypothetical protein QM582_10610 [Micropruina sp.]|uniref:hypothetical protein n=1 Tax=Micropruina sp. TaxID=2737536 RepID=UPI0039E424DF
MEPTYAVRTRANTVEAWSTVRLPFEPKGKLLELRTELRAALGSLVPAPGMQLHAVYGAADDQQFVDTENVLLYNVGTGAFRHLSRHAVVFERSYSYPPPPEDSGMPQDQLRYQRYVIEASAVLQHWRPAGTIASFEVGAASLKTPAAVWSAIRRSAPTPPLPSESPARFLVRLRIRDTRPSHATNLAGLVKPVLDGVISAFHSHAGEAEQVARRLADLGIGEYDLIRRWLADARWAALGPRQLVRPFGPRGVQWNPADDHCVAAAVTIDPTPGDGPRWQLSGELAWAAPR